MPESLLKIKNLKVSVQEDTQEKFLVNGLNFEIFNHEILALVGGSGSGKTTTGLSILRLLPQALSIKEGEIIFKNENLFNFAESRMRKIRGKEIAMIFQEPLYAFNPVFTLEDQIAEGIKVHMDLQDKKIRDEIWELFRLVGISEPQRVAQSYPHQLSGGLRQRAMIAQAISLKPSLIIADEPTSNLDVTLQAHMIELFQKLKKELNLSILLISHDLGMVAHLADRVAILYDGKVVEYGPTQDIVKQARHPFTKDLMKLAAV